MGDCLIQHIKEWDMALSNVVNLRGIEVSSPSKLLAQTLFQRNMIFLNDLPKILGAGASVPLPLIGFEYLPLQRIELLNYSYSQYPYLNRETISNTSIKNPLRFQIQGVKPITSLNTMFLSLAVNIGLLELMDKYVAGGGTFTIVTPWGVLTNCVLEKIEGVQFMNDSGGQGFTFTFQRVNIYEDTAGTQSNFIKALTAGGIP